MNNKIINYPEINFSWFSSVTVIVKVCPSCFDECFVPLPSYISMHSSDIISGAVLN
jgi:hypothetical protein